MKRLTPSQKLIRQNKRGIQVAGIALLPAGAIALLIAILQLHSNGPILGHNPYGDTVGGIYPILFSAAFMCIGMAALVSFIRNKKKRDPADDDEPKS